MRKNLLAFVFCWSIMFNVSAQMSASDIYYRKNKKLSLAPHTFLIKKEKQLNLYVYQEFKGQIIEIISEELTYDSISDNFKGVNSRAKEISTNQFTINIKF